MESNKSWRPVIENCGWAFKVQCPKTWARLKRTDNADIRFCETCLKEVHRVETDEQVIQAAKEGKCVSVFCTELLGSVIEIPKAED